MTGSRSRSTDDGPLERAGDALMDADAAVAKASLPVQDTAAQPVLHALATLSDQPLLRALCGGVVAIGLWRRDARLARTGAAMLAAHELATLAKTIVKNNVDRHRPHALGDNPHGLRPRPGDDRSKEASSFPSGHSAGAAAVARAFARAYPAYGRQAHAAAAAASLVQIPRCAHYPTDIGAGLAIGVASEALVASILDRVAPLRA